MDDQELSNLLQDLESDRVERKASCSDGKKSDKLSVLLLTT
jgi:ATP-dependent DNA helicase RecG